MGGSKKCSSQNAGNSSLLFYCLEARVPHTVPVGSWVRTETILATNHRWWNLLSGEGAQGGQRQIRGSRETMTEPFLGGMGKLWETPLYGLNEGGLGMKARNWSLENKTMWGVGAPKCITHKSHWPSSDLTDALLLPSFNSTFPTVFSVASAYSFWASFSLFWSTREKRVVFPAVLYSFI